MVRLNDHLNMAITVDWDIKPQTIQTTLTRNSDLPASTSILNTILNKRHLYQSLGI